VQVCVWPAPDMRKSSPDRHNPARNSQQEDECFHDSTRYHMHVSDFKESEPAFICDAMLGGLARWLRAAGYDAQFQYGIDDRELLDRARKDARVILSSDGPMFERNVIKSGRLRALYIPQQSSKLQQLQFVLRELSLPLRSPRCMACGGRLTEVPKHTVTGEAPPLTFKHCDRFWRCSRCGKLLWRGTHWQRITKRLEELTARNPEPATPKDRGAG